ncbi:hypothetical protein PAXRUDRAFT_157416 [Paxillus rubicundulus Ve08.2h10]|uniref:Uncharacterized protein n=1 Tax=Paxillus rubicundulus Ve08.2h10 TaxID=930991 RepID=A0A0D0CDZ9_9AGAM|nr:hypothetical protein PAXRUDRAFT_157416 [Paxillus rubicundulus Ve08.2h10]
MQCEYICSCPLWRNESPRLDCIFVTTNPELVGMQGLDVVQFLTFFPFSFRRKKYPCAIVHWFTHSEDPDPNTRMWISWCSSSRIHCILSPDISILHINMIYCAAHLIPVYGTRFIPTRIQPHQPYHIFHAFYVNKFADHHTFEITS